MILVDSQVILGESQIIPPDSQANNLLVIIMILVDSQVIVNYSYRFSVILANSCDS